ncbi:AAA family ATPase [Gordonia alkanivorans]|uniref:AAA family ATPase n=1 Tax=Gordonia TaxID=2053 RepID=UPI0012BB3691|nr:MULTISPECIES: AAA family ATPase [Gordonia]MDH3025303.1 AAA family ATPase [Gordonia alkanivorans]QGP87292.1 AAA family ATPase [Gordonia sp. 135]
MTKEVILGITEEPAVVDDDVAEEIENLQSLHALTEAENERLKEELAKSKTDVYEIEKARDDARERIKAEKAAAKAGTAPVRERLLSVDQFMDAEPPPALVRDVVDGGGLSMLLGHRGSYKTAIALDMALCIACGISWGRHATERGRVLYIVGEGGGRAFGIRLEAWLKHHGVSRDEIRPWFQGLDGAVPFMALAWDELVDFATEYRPALIVVDTLARHQLGLEENSNTDASEAVAKIDELRAKTGAAVMVLHHPPKGGTSARGAGAWEGGADSVFHLEKDEPVKGQVQMTTTKQKHRPETGMWTFRIEQVQVRPNGTWPSSMVPVHADPFAIDKAEEEAKGARDAALQAEVLEYIRSRQAAGMAPNKTEFREHFQETKRREAALDALAELRRRGEVEEVPGSGRAKVLHVVSEAQILPFASPREVPNA